jgi:DNA-binding MarR family transcriptional regulator
VELLAKVFEAAGKEVLAQEAIPADPMLLRRLDHRQKNVLSMFSSRDSLTVKELANNLGLSDRMVRNIVNKWVQEGFLEVLDPSNKNRRYGLSEIYRQFIGNES